MKSEEQRNLLIVLFLINTVYGFLFNMVGVGRGFTLFQAICMYLIGTICNENYEVITGRISRRVGLLTYIFCSAAIGLCSYPLMRAGLTDVYTNIIAYNNPLVVFAAVGFVFVCHWP